MTCPVILSEVCTNFGRQTARATKVCTLTPTIFECCVWNIHYVTFLLLRIFMTHIDFWNSLDDGYLAQNSNSNRTEYEEIVTCTVKHVFETWKRSRAFSVTLTSSGNITGFKNIVEFFQNSVPNIMTEDSPNHLHLQQSVYTWMVIENYGP